MPSISRSGGGIINKGERIPQPLWHEAIELVDTHGVSQVTRTLRLSATDLNKRRGPEYRRARDTFWDIQVPKMTALGDSL